MWDEFHRIISECKPTWIIAENVSRLITIPEYTGILKDLETEGYAVKTFVLSAADYGAPHIRRRAFIIANTGSITTAQSYKKENPIRNEREAWQNVSGGTWDKISLPDWKIYPSKICRMDDGVSRRMDKPRLQALGNAVVPHVVYPFFKAIRAIEQAIEDRE